MFPQPKYSDGNTFFSFPERKTISVFDENSYKDCVIIQETQKDSLFFAKYTDTHFDNPEIYSMQIVKDGNHIFVDIAYVTERGLLYGLWRLQQSADENRFPLGTLCDWPLFRTRGYIEGFYGRPWSHEKQMSMLRFAASCGANAYYYAPKDDPYHRRLWREKYPSGRLEQLAALQNCAKTYGIVMSYCIAPGLNMHYCDDNEFVALCEKTEQLYAIGIRSFGLLLDDIPPQLYYDDDRIRFGTSANAHTELTCRYARFLAEKHCMLTVCPTEYHGDCTGGYIGTLGNGIPEDVRLFYTGTDICSRTVRSYDARNFYEKTAHRPLFWDNYPVNDAEMFMEMHLGPLIGRDGDLWQYAEGEIFNCMEYADCTRLPLGTALQYLWSPENYDPEVAMRLCVDTLIPENEREAFFILSDNLKTSCLKDENSHILNEVLCTVSAALEAGDKEKAEAVFLPYLEKMQKAARLLFGRTDGMYGEAKIWIEKFRLCTEILGLCHDILFKNADCRPQLREAMFAYNRDAVVLTDFCLREFAENVLGDFTY